MAQGKRSLYTTDLLCQKNTVNITPYAGDNVFFFSKQDSSDHWTAFITFIVFNPQYCKTLMIHPTIGKYIGKFRLCVLWWISICLERQNEWNLMLRCRHCQLRRLGYHLAIMRYTMFTWEPQIFTHCQCKELSSRGITKDLCLRFSHSLETNIKHCKKLTKILSYFLMLINYSASPWRH